MLAGVPFGDGFQPSTGVSTCGWYLSWASAAEGREKVAHGASHGNKRVRHGAPEGRKNPFTGIHPSPGTKGLLTPLRGWLISGPVPQGLRPGLFSSAPNGASNRARTRLARREELGIKTQTRVENVETPDARKRPKRVEASLGAGTDAERRPVSQPRSSNRTCRFPAPAFPAGFIERFFYSSLRSPVRWSTLASQSAFQTGTRRAANTGVAMTCHQRQIGRAH